MGQVPDVNMLLLGDGRLARHLAHYFRSLELDFVQWNRREGSDGTLAALAESADRILLAIRDDAIQGFVDRYRDQSAGTWVHFSGSVVADGAWSAHPLGTFGPELLRPAAYRDISIIVDAEGPPLDELIPGLPNPSFSVPRSDRALYHALCVAAGNFTTLLWQRFLGEIEGRWNVPAAAALPYLEQTTANLVAPSRRDALTGPIARGDLGTIRRNVEALDEAGLGDLASVYRVLAGARAARTGRPSRPEEAA